MITIGIDARQLSKERLAGIGHYVVSVINCIVSEKKDVTFILCSNREIKNYNTYGKNVKIKVIPGQIGTFWLYEKIPRYIKDDNIDIFWGPEHVLPKRVKGIKYVLTVHDVALLINPRWGKWSNSIIQNVFVRKSVQNADSIIAISESTKNDLINLLGISEKKVLRIYNGYDSIVEHSKNEVDLINKYNICHPFFLYVGTLEPRKNIESLIKAYEVVRKEYEIDLVLAGGLGWKYDKILKSIDECMFKDGIIRTGYVEEEDKGFLYNNCVGFVFPTHYEGFGIPILEAMSNNAIVITASNSSLMEVGGDAALYVENENDYSELAKKMIDVIEMEGQKKESIRNKGRENVKRFSWKKCGLETLNYLIG